MSVSVVVGWFEKEVVGWREVLRFSVVAMIVAGLWSFLAATVLVPAPQLEDYSQMRNHEILLKFFREYPLTFCGVLLVLAVVEEVVFRLPLVLAKRIFCSTTSVLACAIVFSAVFGYVHAGGWSIPVQGVTGLVLSTIFLKCGGLHGRAIKALSVVTFSHFLFNVSFFQLEVLGY